VKIALKQKVEQVKIALKHKVEQVKIALKFRGKLCGMRSWAVFWVVIQPGGM